MQETTPQQSTNAVISSGRGVWYASIAFFALSLVVTGALYVIISMMNSSIDTTKAEVATIRTSISQASTDRNIVIAKIIQDNTLRPSIDLKNIVTQFRVAAMRANVIFDGFSIKDDTISTQLIATEGTTSHPDAVATIIEMMNTYDNTAQQFRLWAISSVTGDMSRRTTGLDLHVVNPSIQ